MGYKVQALVQGSSATEVKQLAKLRSQVFTRSRLAVRPSQSNFPGTLTLNVINLL